MSKVAPLRHFGPNSPWTLQKMTNLYFFSGKDKREPIKKDAMQDGKKKNQSMTHLVYRSTVLFLQCSLTTLSQRMPQDSLFLETQLGQRSITQGDFSFLGFSAHKKNYEAIYLLLNFSTASDLWRKPLLVTGTTLAGIISKKEQQEYGESRCSNQVSCYLVWRNTCP